MSLDQITIRPAETRDATAVAQVHDRAWRGAYRGIIPGVALERMVERRGPRWWARLIRHQRTVLVLEVHGTIAGYATLGANRSKTLRVHGEIYELYIDPAYQGLGFGSRLFNAARERLKAARLGHFVVWALEDNASAIGFYQAIGGEPVAHGVETFGPTQPSVRDSVGGGGTEAAVHLAGQCRKLAFIWGTGQTR